MKQLADSLLNSIITDAQDNYDRKISRTSGLMGFYCIDRKSINSELNGTLCVQVSIVDDVDKHYSVYYAVDSDDDCLFSDYDYTRHLDREELRAVLESLIKTFEEMNLSEYITGTSC